MGTFLKATYCARGGRLTRAKPDTRGPSAESFRKFRILYVFTPSNMLLVGACRPGHTGTFLQKIPRHFIHNLTPAIHVSCLLAYGGRSTPTEPDRQRPFAENCENFPVNYYTIFLPQRHVHVYTSVDTCRTGHKPRRTFCRNFREKCVHNLDSQHHPLD